MPGIDRRRRLRSSTVAERQVAEFTIKTATPTIGSLAFTLDASGAVTGTLDLDAELITPHPVRVGVVWLQGQFRAFQEQYWQSVLLQNGQASMVVYVDVNENVVLDLSSSVPLIDHVLASGDFPQLALGHLAALEL